MAKANVATRNAQMEKVYQDSRTLRALAGGTKGMRELGELYLPKRPKESTEAYETRLNSSFLYNKTMDTIKTVAGKLFSKPMTADDMLQSVDSEGRDITRFAHDVTMDALQVGVTYVMADYTGNEDIVTREDAKKANVRPFLLHIKQENLLSYQSEFVGSEEALTRVNILEEVLEQDEDNEFQFDLVQQVRVYRVVDGVMTTEVWRKPDGKDWSLFSEPIATSMSYIPLNALYTCRTGFMTGKPPYQDIADLNVRHWISRSSQDHILDFCRFPMLFAKGLENDDTTVGANVMLRGIADENSDAKYIETNGKAVEAGANDLENIESQMDALSKQVLNRQSGNITATARAIDESSSNTDIQTLANIIEDTFNSVVGDMGEWSGEDYGD